MKVLAVSIGNRSIIGGVFAGSRLTRRFQFEHGGLSPAGIARRLQRTVPAGVDRIALCSVVPVRTRAVATVLRRLCGKTPKVLTAVSQRTLQVAYREPRLLGADRVAAAIGAHRGFPRRNLIVVDCGTATTITAIHRQGVIRGGAILPGPHVAARALGAGTAQLPTVKISRSSTPLGRTPEDAIRSGLFHGHAGAIRELVQLVGSAAFGRSPALVVGTGGGARSLRGENLFTVIAPNLILTGLFAFATQDTDA